ncbi:MAG: RsiV family protein [Bacillota bacterium]|nr:RsiV family protein [Bacillota bacterium]MDW7684754.1 RsiV family protein [Bacillota bacterium]
MQHQGGTASIVERRIHTNTIDVVFPSVFGLKNEAVQEKINTLIESIVRGMMTVQGSQDPNLAEMVGTFTIELNKENLLSIRFENFVIRKMAANGTTLLEALTVDLKTGKVYSLNDLFVKTRPYRIQLNKIIEAQIKQQDIPTIGPFPGVKDDQDFYLKPKSLVIFFQELVFTPHFVGPPEFEIPYSQLTGLINMQGPIGRLIR